jgi:uncharacterized LabA/DUF88 family protein
LKVWVYIDGFNFYNGKLRGTPYKWLNLLTFCQTLLPNDQIDRVKYFTAQVDPRANDPDQPYRQMTYWRALRTLGCVDIIEGHFLTKATKMPMAASVQQIKEMAHSGKDVSGVKPLMFEVVRSEEKGTDVNLATHLVHDAHMSRFEAAAIISNDSDLVEAVRIVKEEVGKIVGVFTPHPERPSAELKKTASFFREIQTKHLRNCLFPDPITDAKGTFHKPTGW